MTSSIEIKGVSVIINARKEYYPLLIFILPDGSGVPFVTGNPEPGNPYHLRDVARVTAYGTATTGPHWIAWSAFATPSPETQCQGDEHFAIEHRRARRELHCESWDSF